MKDLHRVSVIAIVLIVLLRVSIGWQFLYEGLWKQQTLTTPTPWTSEGYLKNAQGPMRDYFRSMTGDPDDLKWLDYAAMSEKWYAWRDAFAKHYKLDEKQLKILNLEIDGSEEADSAPNELPPTRHLSQSLKALPASVDLKKLPISVTYDAGSQQLIATQPILPSEETAVLSMVDVVRNPDRSFGKRTDNSSKPEGTELEFYQAVERLVVLSRELSYRHKLAAALRGNPANTGVTWAKNEKGTYDIVMGTVQASVAGEEKNNVQYGKIQEYKDLVDDYNRSMKKAKLDYQYDHANMLGKKLAILRAELVGPIRSLDASLRQSGINLLTPEQLKIGVMPALDSPLARSDKQVMWGLIVLGVMLIIGLGTRVAAVLGAVMLMMFYMVMPPWPGIPVVPGPEHALIVNKNMIEAIALIAIASLPTGAWFGVDALFYNLFRRFQAKSKAAPATATPTLTKK
ncbi:DoxX family protein [Planctomicrobium sp. SH668]|uniref:DoxX family protein n=1 Tax=Planctomicrobium sp. SH668 TaxID=3448126 RepID=UPI003F5BF58C